MSVILPSNISSSLPSTPSRSVLAALQALSPKSPGILASSPKLVIQTPQLINIPNPSPPKKSSSQISPNTISSMSPEVVSILERIRSTSPSTSVRGIIPIPTPQPKSLSTSIDSTLSIRQSPSHSTISVPQRILQNSSQLLSPTKISPSLAPVESVFDDTKSIQKSFSMSVQDIPLKLATSTSAGPISNAPLISVIKAPIISTVDRVVSDLTKKGYNVGDQIVVKINGSDYQIQYYRCIDPLGNRVYVDLSNVKGQGIINRNKSVVLRQSPTSHMSPSEKAKAIQRINQGEQIMVVCASNICHLNNDGPTGTEINFKVEQSATSFSNISTCYRIINFVDAVSDRWASTIEENTKFTTKMIRDICAKYIDTLNEYLKRFEAMNALLLHSRNLYKYQAEVSSSKDISPDPNFSQQGVLSKLQTSGLGSVRTNTIPQDGDKIVSLVDEFYRSSSVVAGMISPIDDSLHTIHNTISDARCQILPDVHFHDIPSENTVLESSLGPAITKAIVENRSVSDGFFVKITPFL